VAVNQFLTQVFSQLFCGGYPLPVAHKLRNIRNNQDSRQAAKTMQVTRIVSGMKKIVKPQDKAEFNPSIRPESPSHHRNPSPIQIQS
jgi:hypothetical protein